MKPRHGSTPRARMRWNPLLVIGMVIATLITMSGIASAETQDSFQGQVTSNAYSATAGSGATSSNSGAPLDPLRYDCTHPTSGPAGCQHLGLTHGYYDGHVVNFLYTANFWCDHSVTSKAKTGCEAGATYNHLPPDATSQDTLYIPTPLGFTPSQGLQCPTSGNCIDHPSTVDVSALYPVLKPLLHLTSASQLDNAALSPHSHVIYTRNDNLPEWWNVVVVPVTSQAGFNRVIATTSQAQLAADLGKDGVYTSTVPTNVFLYFQVLPGTSTAAAEAATSQNVYNGADGPPPAPAGQLWDPLTSDCAATSTATVPPCATDGIGLTKSFYDGHVVNLLYTENYYCDKSVSSSAPDGCEAGASYNKLPPGTTSSNEIDPLYIITPLFKPQPSGLQCPTSGYCIDHPTTVDLSRLSSTLDPILGTTPTQLGNVPLTPHSHIVLTANNNQPEWWPVEVIGVTSEAAYNQIVTSSNEYATAQSLASSGSGVTEPIPTNIFLWFEVLPGAPYPPGQPATGAL